MSETPTCAICGEPMPKGEEMFKFHGYSGPCPKEPLPKAPVRIPPPDELAAMEAVCSASIRLKIAQDEHIFAQDHKTQFGDPSPSIDAYEKAETEAGATWLDATRDLRSLREGRAETP